MGSGILVFAIASTIAIISHCSLYLSDLRLHARSSQILQTKIESLRQQSWDQLGGFPTSFFDSMDTNHLYRGSVMISDYQTYNGTATVRLATVVVVWTNRHDKVISNSLTTLISDGGLNKLYEP